MSRVHDDAGETLVELLVTIAVVAIGFVAVVGAVAAAVDVSTMHRRQAAARAYLRTWAESVERATAGGYTTCPGGPTSALSAPANPPAGITPRTPSVSAWSTANGTTGFAACGSVGTDLGVQRVALAVTAEPGLLPAFDETLLVVVRRP